MKVGVFPDSEAFLIIPAAGGEVTLTPAIAELGLPEADNTTREPKRFKRLREERAMKEAS